MPGEPDTDLKPLDKAKLALKVVDDLGELTPDERIQWIVAGASAGKAQQAYLLHAGVLALLSIAESLEALATKAGAEG